jgi:Fe-S cluster assembly iron-binding protein IscA
VLRDRSSGQQCLCTNIQMGMRGAGASADVGWCSPLNACQKAVSASADDRGKFDELVEEHGVRILVEPAALMHVIGTTMDFVEDRIK